MMHDDTQTEITALSLRTLCTDDCEVYHSKAPTVDMAIVDLETADLDAPGEREFEEPTICDAAHEWAKARQGARYR